MSAPAKINFKVYQGSTFSEDLRWEAQKKVYKPITGITQAAPCVVTCVGHGVPDGWRVKITNVNGMKEINNSDTYLTATVLTPNTIELNTINSVGYTAYTTGGILEYNMPMDLTGYTARMQIRDKIDSVTFIKELTTLNGGLVVDNTNKKISIIIDAVSTAAFTFNTAVYSIELVNGSTVIPFAGGVLTLVKEVTR